MISASAEWLAALQARSGSTPVDLVEAELVDGSGAAAPLRVWSGLGDLSWDGKTWSGLGELLEIAPLTSTGGAEQSSVTITLAATDAMLALLASRRTQGRRVRIWRGWLTASGTLISPVLIATLALDAVVVEDDQVRPVVHATAIDVLSDLDRPRLRRLSPETQARRDPTDRGFEYTASMDRAELDVGRGYWRREARRAG